MLTSTQVTEMLVRFARLVRDRTGITAVECGLIVGIVVVTMVAGFQFLGETTNGVFIDMNTPIESETVSAP
jgi:Flp pilus assembly pilin Flp